MTLIPDDKIREMQERVEKATPGPWTHNHFDAPIGDTGDYEHCDRLEAKQASGNIKWIADDWGGQNKSCENFDFIAHARTDIPKLLAERKELLAERDRLIAIINDQKHELVVQEECRTERNRLAGIVEALTEKEPMWWSPTNRENRCVLCGARSTSIGTHHHEECPYRQAREWQAEQSVAAQKGDSPCES